MTAKDSEPFELNLNAVKPQGTLAPWRIVWGKDNRRWTFKHLELLNEWALVAGADAGDGAAMRTIFREALGKDQWEDFEKIPMPRYQAKEMWKRYQKHCDVEPGESGGSTDS